MNYKNMLTDIKIKVCGMREPDNIRQLVNLQPDFIGFVFYPKSKRYVGEIIDRKKLSLIPPSIKKVGVVVDEPFETLINLVKDNHLDYLQLHGNENPGLCLQLKNMGIRVTKAFSMDEQFDFSRCDGYLEVTDYFLFDTKCDTKGGSGKKFNWKMLENYKLNQPFFLSGGIGKEDIDEIMKLKQKKNIFAVDINSRFEIEPGLKDISMIERFITSLRNYKTD